MAIEYYIALQEPTPKIDGYSEDDLYSLARKQRSLGLDLVLFDNETKAESEAETREDGNHYIICQVTVTDEPDNEELVNSTVRASQLSYLKVSSIIDVEQVEQQQVEVQTPVQPDSPSQTQSQQQSSSDEASTKVTQDDADEDVEVYVVLREDNPKEDQYSTEDFFLLAKKQAHTILIEEESFAKQLAQYRFDITGKTQLICKIQTYGIHGEEARAHIAQYETLDGNLLKLHEKLELIGVSAITEKSKSTQKQLTKAAPIYPGFVSASILTQQKQESVLTEQEQESESSAARTKPYSTKVR